jgi:hypothetical protein
MRGYESARWRVIFSQSRGRQVIIRARYREHKFVLGDVKSYADDWMAKSGGCSTVGTGLEMI